MKTLINIMNDIVSYTIIDVEKQINFLGTEKIIDDDFNQAILSAKNKAEQSKEDYLKSSLQN